MIEVCDFYENGCTMDGKENRVMLKKDGKTYIEMVFSGNEVEIKGMIKEYSVKKYFDQITLMIITTNFRGEPLVLSI